jgi:hypothetical protein
MSTHISSGIADNQSALVERKESLLRQLNTYYRRLSYAEEKKASFGLNTPYDVVEEIRTAKEEIELITIELDEINTQLGTIKTKNGQTDLVEIKLPGNLEDVSPEQREVAIAAAVGALAGVLGIPADQVWAKYLGPGSVHLRLRLPGDAAKQLTSMHHHADPALAEFELKSVQLFTPEQQCKIAHNWAESGHHESLAGFDLRKCYLQNIDLGGVDLSESNLSQADLRGADLRGANLRQANLQGATYNDQTIWPPNFDPATAGAIKTNN